MFRVFDNIILIVERWSTLLDRNGSSETIQSFFRGKTLST